jgi:hypothetical protein
MPPRAVLNAVYAQAVKGMDSEQRDEFDNDLYGLTAENLAANRALRQFVDIENGGE